MDNGAVENYLNTNLISPIHSHREGLRDPQSRWFECRIMASHFYYAVGQSLSKGFVFQTRTHRYFRHRYNMTWRNERAVEIPIALDFLSRHKGARILEVGNVLSHYFPFSHDVLDLYERGSNVISEDALYFKPASPYDVIVGLSTFEHMGFDEETKDPDKPLLSLKNLLRHALNPGGLLLATVPHGYNPSLDEAINKRIPPIENVNFLERKNFFNRWRETTLPTVVNGPERVSSPKRIAVLILKA